MEELIAEFLAQRSFAVVGSFRNETKYAYKILKDLRSKGYEVYPVNPSIKEVEGIKCYPTIRDIPKKIDVVNLVTPPKITEEIVNLCKQAGITRVWMQPGAQSQKAIDLCNESGIKVVYDACVMLGKKV